MGEPLELLVGIFHLVVLSVENNRLLDLLYHLLVLIFVHVFATEIIVADTELLDAEIELQRVLDRFPSYLADVAFEYL